MNPIYLVNPTILSDASFNANNQQHLHGQWRSMNPTRLRSKSLYLALSLIGVLGSYAIVSAFMPAPEIALTLGEPWEEMRQRSTARILEAISGSVGFRTPKTDARLRFIDPQYGFTTPPARFFVVGFLGEDVRNVHISPQIEPLLLEDALSILLELQNQLIVKGWVNIGPRDNPSFADTPEWRKQLRDIYKVGTTFWQAADKYQVMLTMQRFKYSKHPKEERYLITLILNAPWVPKEEDEPYLPRQPDHPESCKLQCK